MPRQRLLVVGNGMAGQRFLEELVARMPGRFAITVIGAERPAAYNRVLLTPLLAGEIEADDLALRPASWYGEQDIELITGRTVCALDTARRTVGLDDGTTLAFDVLVAATGSDPIVLGVPGAELAGVETFRTLADVDAFDRFVATGRPAVVIGGGLLGIEAAYGLAKRGVEVTLVHLMDRLMERQLDTSGAALLAKAIHNLGMRVVLGAQTRAVHGNRAVEAVELADGRRIACGLVVMAVGIRPRTRWAQGGGLQVSRGVVVDDRMRTSAPGIYAIGECAEHRGICYGLVEPCYEQARVAAAAVAGETLSYAGSMLATNLKVSGVPVFSAGDFEGADADSIVMRDASGPSYRKLVTRNGCLTGAVLVGDTTDSAWYSDLIRSGRSVAAIRASLAFGQAFAEAA